MVIAIFVTRLIKITVFLTRLFIKRLLVATPLVKKQAEKSRGGIPEWPKGSDCKSDGSAFEGSNPSPSTIILKMVIAIFVTRLIKITVFLARLFIKRRLVATPLVKNKQKNPVEGFPSGQRDQIVNLTAPPSKVRILLPPPSF
jgi:hypothetical protein